MLFTVEFVLKLRQMARSDCHFSAPDRAKTYSHGTKRATISWTEARDDSKSARIVLKFRDSMPGIRSNAKQNSPRLPSAHMQSDATLDVTNRPCLFLLTFVGRKHRKQCELFTRSFYAPMVGL